MNYQICNRCVMDTSDPLISFDKKGLCNYCNEFYEKKINYWYPNEQGKKKLKEIIYNLKLKGKNKQYDAILGLSGGIDSSYLALRSKEWGLRLLVVHVDGGWNSEMAVSNIDKLVDYCGYELVTNVIDWNEMRDLQLSYLKAGVSNQDVPQDHAYFASLYKFSVESDISTILSGGNLATECINPDWMFDPLDLANIKAIHKINGRLKLKNFPKLTFYQRYFLYPFFKKLKVLRPLNYINYNKENALLELKKTVGWKDYGRKHGESHFTKFYQNFYLPYRYNYDKRRPHFSSLIVTEQMTRHEAILKLEKPLYSKLELEKDLDYTCNKLEISRSELKKFIELEPVEHETFSNQQKIFLILKKIQRVFEKLSGKRLKFY